MSKPDEQKKSALMGAEMFIGVLVVLIIAAMIEYLLNVHSAIFTITILMIALMTAILLIRAIFPGFVMKIAPDERIKKARAKAAIHSWALTFVLMAALELAIRIYKLDLTASDALLYTQVLMIYSFLILSWYYGRKPDIELV